MIYVESKEKGRWSVNGEGRDVQPGDRVGFLELADASYFVSAGRAVFAADGDVAQAPADTTEPEAKPRKKAKPA